MNRDLEVEAAEEEDGERLHFVYDGHWTAAGHDLTVPRFQHAVESLGKIHIAAMPDGSFAPRKLDAQNSFQLMQFNKQWKPATTIQMFTPVGSSITFKG